MRRHLTPSLVISLIALVLSTTGFADAARHAVTHAVTKMFAGHPVSTKPHAGGILLLGKNRKFAAAAIPTVADTLRVGGKTANDLEPLCPANTANLGTWCLEKQPYPVSKEEAGKANYFWVNQKCAELGGFLPSASELVGAAKLVDLEGGPGLGGKREMSATLITTAAGSDAAGSEGVSEGSLGNPRAGEPNPVPVPAVPEPQTAQYVTVFSDNQHGGLAGGEPVSTPQNFRCGFYKMPAGAAKGG